jgi:UDP-2,4-diacetamido-2,4,6-trideoxy-beta-L-altropyranose hydrolase
LKILFRVNAGKDSGLGHLSRNLTLAKEFFKVGFNCHFLVQSDDQEVVDDYFLYNDFPLNCVTFSQHLSKDKDLSTLVEFFKNGRFDFLVLDHYNHDESYQLKLKEYQIKWAQFDYSASMPVHANVLINANIGVTEKLYQGLISESTQLCVGEKYAIISEKITRVKPSPEVDRILIALGGTEYSHELIAMINYVTKNTDFKFDIVTSIKKNLDRLDTRCNVIMHYAPDNPALIYAKCDVAIVAGGVTTYELAYLGVPMIIVPFATNQVKNAVLWRQYGFGVSFEKISDFLNQAEDFGFQFIINRVKNEFNPTSKIDGLGSQRIVYKITSTFLC